MASTAVHPQSPPRKRARLSLKFIRKEQQPTVPEEPAETEEQEQRQEQEPEPNHCDAVPDSVPGPLGPVYQEENHGDHQSTSCIPSEYVITVAPYTGLHNLGNTCYLNSVLQVLRYCPSFAVTLEKLSDVVATVLKAKEEEDGGEEEDERSRRRRKEFILQLRLVQKLNKLFNVMLDKEQTFLDQMMPSGQELAMYPEDILEAIRDLNPMFKGYLQHDAQELLCCILCNVQEAFQQLCAQRESPSSSSNVCNGSGSPTTPCMKAVRKLDMNGPGEGATAEGDDSGKLLGGGRPTVLKNSSSYKKMNKEELGNGGFIKHQDNGVNGHTLPGSKLVNGDSKNNLCNGTGPHSTKFKKNLDTVGNLAGSISPSSDSVRRRGGKKSGLTNGHLKEKEVNGLNGDVHHAVDGAGDAGSSKKKRLGMSRIVTFQQSSILNKFNILKKDKSSPTDEEPPTPTSDTDHSQAQEDTEQPMDVAQSEQETTSEDAVSSRNVTSNNSNDSDTSLDMTHESVSMDVGSPVSAVKPDPGISENLQAPGHDRIQKEEVAGAAYDEQEDAKPLLEVECRHDNDMQLVERVFQGTLALRTRCLECESCSEKRENFQDVSVPVQSIPTYSGEDEEERVADVNPRNLSLGWALSEFTSVERLTDDNKYFCEHCEHLTEAERSVLFGRLPGVLIIQLKRFSAFTNCFSPGGSVSKVNDHLAVPLSLSLARWCSKSCPERNKPYELCAVVAHTGSSSSSGHYTAYTRVPEKMIGPIGDASACTQAQENVAETWANFDDDRVQLLSDEDFNSLLNPLPGNDSAATPYLLLYRQRNHQT